jgi:hypothetical protein
MSGSNRPLLADSLWSEWLRKFPNRPARDRYDLATTVKRIADQLAALPDRALLTPGEQTSLRQWLEDYGFELEMEQRDPVRIFETIDVVNFGTIAIGLAAASFLAPLTIGALVVTGGLWSRKIARNAEAAHRQQLVDKIRRLLRDLIRSMS